MVHQNSFEMLIALYLFFAGLGAGAILTAVVLDVIDREKYINFIKAASLLGMPLVSLGCGFLLLDLGQGLTKPWLLVFLFLNPTSAITWGTAILTAFIIVSTGYAAYNFGFIRCGAKYMRIALIPLGIGTAGYTAVLLGALRAIPFWNQTGLPMLFLVSAISTGIAAMIIVTSILFKETENHLLEKIHMFLIAGEILIVGSMFLIGLNGVPEMVHSIKLLLSGDFAAMFWIGFVLLGLLAPLMVNIAGIVYKIHITVKVILLAEVLTLVGGFLLRYLILHAGVFADKFAGFM